VFNSITQRSDVGSYAYHASRTHAVVSAGSIGFAYDANGNVTSRGGVTQTWASYDLPTTLAGNGWQSQFAYGPSRNHWKQIATSSGGTVTTTYIAGLLEKVVRGTLTEWRHQVATPTGLAAVYSRRSDGSADTYYLTTDHLGSTDRVLRAAGGTVQVAESFGAFGARRGSDWSGSPSTSDWTAIGNTTRRGFTGHEHLDNVGLIHMNGRVYDPVVGRFMSVDPIVRDIGAPQAWNSYAYVEGRVGSWIDPTGWTAAPNDCEPARETRIRDGAVEVIGNRWLGDLGSPLPGGPALLYGRTNLNASYLGGGGNPRSPPPASNTSEVPAPVLTATRDGPRPPTFSPEVYRTMAMALEFAGYVLIAFDAANTVTGLLAGPDTSLAGLPLITLAGSMRVTAAAGAGAAATRATSGTLRGLGNIGSHGAVDAGTALGSAQQWLGAGYKEIAPGVFRSADGLRQFRMTNADLLPTHGRIGWHVHFEALNDAGKVIENLHLPVGP